MIPELVPIVGRASPNENGTSSLTVERGARDAPCARNMLSVDPGQALVHEARTASLLPLFGNELLEVELMLIELSAPLKAGSLTEMRSYSLRGIVVTNVNVMEDAAPAFGATKPIVASTKDPTAGVLTTIGPKKVSAILLYNVNATGVLPRGKPFHGSPKLGMVS